MIVTRPRTQAASISQAAHKFSEIASNCASHKKTEAMASVFRGAERYSAGLLDAHT